MIGRRGRPIAALACVFLSALTGCIPSGTANPGGAVTPPAPSVSASAGPGSPATPVSAAPQAEATAAPAPISVYAIPRAAESVVAYLDGLEAQLEASAVVEEVRRELPAIESALASLDRGRGSRSPEETPRSDLADRRQEYLRQGERLETLEVHLEKRGKELQDRLEEIRGLADLWSRTREQAVADAAPEAIIGRVEGVLSGLDRTRDAIRSRQGGILASLAEVSGRRMTADAAVREVDAALKADQDRLFRVESATLVSALRHPPNRFGLTGEILDVWRENARAFTRFASESGGRILLQGGMFAALLGLFAALRPVMRRRAGEDESLAITAWILGRPVAAAALITLIVTFWIHPLAPRVVFRAAMLLMVMPLVRLLPGLLEARLLPGLRRMASLYVFDRLVAFVSPHTLLLRLLLLVVTAAAALLLAWELRPAGGLGSTEGPRRQWGRLAGWVSLGLLGISLVANVGGNVSLAELLSRGVLVAAYAGVAFYAAARILESLWTALLATPGARHLRVVSHHGALLRQRGVRLIVGVASLVWALAVLRVFGLFGPMKDGLGMLLRTPWTIGDVTVSLGSIVLFIVMLVVAVTLGRFLRFVLDESVLPYVSLPRGVPTAISVSAQYVVIASGLLLAMSASGVAMDRFTFLVGALGVGIGFGLQNVVNNFVSGLILLYERPVQNGDIIEVGPLLGEVRRIGVRSSTVRTYDGAEVIVPNANLIAQEVVNWTLSDRTRRVEIKLGVAYGTDPARVIDLLVGAVRGRPGVLETPQPVALFEGFGDSSLDFVLRFWTADFDRWIQLRSEARAAIYEAVRGAGIEIPFPQHDLHVRTPPADVPRVEVPLAGGPRAD